MREIDLKQANYFHKGFLTFNVHKRIPIITYLCIFYQNAVSEIKQVKPLTLMASTKSAQLLPENSLDALMASIVLGNQSSFDGSTLLPDKSLETFNDFF